jgi:hypothetical protein
MKMQMSLQVVLKVQSPEIVSFSLLEHMNVLEMFDRNLSKSVTCTSWIAMELTCLGKQAAECCHQKIIYLISVILTKC